MLRPPAWLLGRVRYRVRLKGHSIRRGVSYVMKFFKLLKLAYVIQLLDNINYINYSILK